MLFFCLTLASWLVLRAQPRSSAQSRGEAQCSVVSLQCEPLSIPAGHPHSCLQQQQQLGGWGKGDLTATVAKLSKEKEGETHRSLVLLD